MIKKSNTVFFEIKTFSSILKKSVARNSKKKKTDLPKFQEAKTLFGLLNCLIK